MTTIFDLANRLERGPGRAVFHSGAPADVGAVTSYAASRPTEIFKVKNGQGELWSNDGKILTQQGPALSLLQKRLDAYQQKGKERVPIAMGVLSYDFGRSLMRLRAAQGPLPQAWIGFYPAFVSLTRDSTNARVIGWDSEACQRISSSLSNEGEKKTLSNYSFGALCASKEDDRIYLKNIETIKNYLKAGDAYQVNLARELVASIYEHGDPLSLLRACSNHAPTAFSGMVEMEEGCVVSASPERLFVFDGQTRRLETRPIKGTRKGLAKASEDRATIRDLVEDPKEQAEHLMIVDLERNDLGKIAEVGSVHVEAFAEVVTLPTIHHLISTISARAREGVSQVGIIQAMFPGGSITGAPKKRAMEIIEECEPSPRGMYCGSFCLFYSDGSMELSITIRSAELVSDTLSLRVGGGIVMDSTAEREFTETNEKAAGWRHILNSFRQ